MLYELTTLRHTFADPVAISAEALSHVGTSEAGGTLIGCWRSEFGPQNRVVLLRSFESVDALVQERTRILSAPNPFGVVQVLIDLEFETLLPFPGFPTLEPARLGPYYEFRTYKVRPGRLTSVLHHWANARDWRNQFSPFLLAMYALDGSSRIVHVWPYLSLAEREEARTRAALAGREEGTWPPPEGLDNFEPNCMQSALLLALPGSPLQ